MLPLLASGWIQPTHSPYSFTHSVTHFPLFGAVYCQCMKSDQPLYRPIILRALKTAWLHKELWPIAAIAGIAGTGTVLNDILTQGNGALAFPETGGGAFSFISFLQIYFGYLVAATPQTAMASFFLFSLVVCFIVWVITTAQHVILRAIHRATQLKKRLSFRELLTEAERPRIIRLFVINIFFKLLIVNSLLVGSLLLHGLNTSTVIADAFFGFIFAFLIVAVVFALNVLEVFSLIQVAKANDGIVDAIQDAWKMFSNHKAVSLEMSAVLFGINFLMTVGYILGIVIISVPFLFLFGLAIGSGSLTAVSAVSLSLVVTFITVTIAMAGFVTTFTLSAWTELVYKLSKAKSPVHARLHKHGARLFAQK